MTTIERIRTEKGMNQRTIAAIMGISVTRYRSIEHRPHRATVDEAEALSVILRTPISLLFPDLAELDISIREVKNHALIERRQ